MSMTIDDIVCSAMQLDPEDRAEVAERLWASLDSQQRAVIDAAWAEEAERRIDEIDQGTASTIPADEVFARIEKQSRASRH